MELAFIGVMRLKDAENMNVISYPSWKVKLGQNEIEMLKFCLQILWTRQ